MSVKRHFTVATFVVDGERVLMLWHRKLSMWLPPGGHVERDELPDEAAAREVKEETGIDILLLPEDAGEVPAGPARLSRPEGIQLEDIAPGHQHIDLVYFAIPAPGTDRTPRGNGEGEQVGWYTSGEMVAQGANEEILHWVSRAIHTVETRSVRREL